MESNFQQSLPGIDPKLLLARQVEELYDAAPTAVIFSFVGAIITLAVLAQTGDLARGIYWFAFSTFVLLIRGTTLWRYRQQPQPVADGRPWANAMVAGNFLAGIQWGILGTVLFASTDIYRELFTIMMIVGLVGGSVTPFAPVKWAHPAVSIPSALPSIVYIFFIHGGVQWLPGTMALFFMFTVIFFGLRHHHTVTNRLIVELRYKALLASMGESNSQLGHLNSELKYRSEIVKRAQLKASSSAAILARHVDRTLLPVIECDAHFVVVNWNAAAAHVLGYGAGEARGRNLGELLFPPERQANIRAFIDKLFRDDKPTTIDMFAVTRSGQRIPVRFYVTPIMSEEGTPLRIAVIVTDAYADSSQRSPRTPAAAGY
jgi:PAS domain S-box-containing protein